MRDTPPEVEARYRALLLARSGQERLRMGSDMLDAARELAHAGLRAQGVEDLRVGLFLRLYGDDYDPEELARIVARLRAFGREGPEGSTSGSPVSPTGPPDPEASPGDR